MAIASAEDVAIRLGRALTSAEEAMVDQVVATVSGLILEVAGTDEPDPVPAYYTALCIEKVIAVGSNPNQLASMSEQLGAFQHSQTFRGRFGDGSDLFLTDDEQREIRRIANGKVSDSVRTKSLLDDVYVTEAQ